MLLLSACSRPFSRVLQVPPSLMLEVYYLIFSSFENLLRVLAKGQNQEHLHQRQLRNCLKTKDK